MKYFKLREFVCSCGCGKNKINRTFVKVLDAARAYSKDENGSDIPFIITSGYRCENHPVSKPTSSHIKGLASDILVKNSRERAVILAALMNAGFTRFGISSKKNGPNFIHVDLDEDKIQGVIWTY